MDKSQRDFCEFPVRDWRPLRKRCLFVKRNCLKASIYAGYRGTGVDWCETLLVKFVEVIVSACTFLVTRKHGRQL